MGAATLWLAPATCSWPKGVVDTAVSEGTRVVSKAVILLFTYKFELAAQPIDAL